MADLAQFLTLASDFKGSQTCFLPGSTRQDAVRVIALALLR